MDMENSSQSDLVNPRDLFLRPPAGRAGLPRAENENTVGALSEDMHEELEPAVGTDRRISQGCSPWPLCIGKDLLTKQEALLIRIFLISRKPCLF